MTVFPRRMPPGDYLDSRSRSPRGAAASSANSRTSSARAAACALRAGQRRSSTTISMPAGRFSSVRNTSLTMRFIRLRSTARGATRRLVMIPMRAWERPFALAYNLKWRRACAAPVASVAVKCSRRCSRAPRGSARLVSLRRSIAPAPWRGAPALHRARPGSASARGSRACACGASPKADRSVSWDSSGC